MLRKLSLKISMKIWELKWSKVASKTSDNAGDGTTTATVLAQAVVREGMKFVAAGMNPMDLKGVLIRQLIALLLSYKN